MQHLYVKVLPVLLRKRHSTNKISNFSWEESICNHAKLSICWNQRKQYTQTLISDTANLDYVTVFIYITCWCHVKSALS